MHLLIYLSYTDQRTLYEIHYCAIFYLSYADLFLVFL